VEKIRTIGDYKIVRELSRSSIASVYEGDQPSLDRHVLIKRLHPELIGDEDIRVRFEREAHSLAKIKHKNIVHIYDFQVSEESVYLVAEWIAGGSLEQRLKDKGTLSEREAVALALDVLEGLHVALQAGIIHRDIKPANLLISHSGDIKITDFGLAQFEGSPSVTMQGMVVGTPAYLAPEVVAGQPSDVRCDLYAVGVTLYEMMTGINPFLADSISETLSRVMNVKPTPLEGVSQITQELLFWLLEKKPDKRPSTPEEALKEFRALAVQHDIERGWADIEDTGYEAGNGTPVSDSPEAVGRIRPRPKAKPAKIWVIAAMLAMVLAVVAVFVGVSITTDEEKLPGSTTENETQIIDGQSGEKQDDLNSGLVNQLGETVNNRNISQGNNQKSPTSRLPSEEQKPPTTENIKGNLNESGENALNDQSELAINDMKTNDQADPAKPGFGHLMLHVNPWANLYYRDRFLAQTPYSRPLKLPSGKVELFLSNPDLHIQSFGIEFSIPVGDTLREFVDLLTKVGVIRQIDASPWATVYINGELFGDTPIDKEIFLPFGSHEFRFVHPEFGEKVETIDIAPGEPPKAVRISYP